MHLTRQTVTLLGSLSFALAGKTMDLGYMKCASAVAQSTSFPSCKSSYKLDCFCEAQKASHDSTARVQIAQEAEDLCAENGVPREEITKYLCDDTAVPTSPRRGSTPMVRLGGQQEEEQEQKQKQQKPSPESPEVSNKEHGECHKPETTASKRAIQPDSTRLLIPENNPEPDTKSDENKDNVKDQNSDTKTEEGKDKGNDKGEEEERKATTNDADDTNAAVAVVTVTETVCSCDEEATTTPGSEHSPETSTDNEAKAPEPTSGATHGTEGVESSATESTRAVVSTVRAASSNDAGATPIPTGVDGERQNGPKESESARPSGQMFEGGAAMNGVSKSVIVGVLGVVGGMTLL